jgi:tetratricopeptide (TPR) repeat protein
MASNASQAGNYAEAESYCNKIIEINPKHSRAWQLKGTAAGWQSTLANVRIEESMNCFNNAIEYANSEEADEVKSAIANDAYSLSVAIVQLACNHFSEFPDNDTYETVSTHTDLVTLGMSHIVDTCGGNREELNRHIASIVVETAFETYQILRTEYINESHPSEYEWKRYREGGDGCLWLLRDVLCGDVITAKDKISYYKRMINMQQELTNSCSWTYSDGGYTVEYALTDEAKKYRIDEIMEWHNSIKGLDPTYIVPSRPTATTPGGCYVATAIYGSYDCPEVWTLRRFRDFTLAESWYGRIFIKIYYSISPMLVRWFGEAIWFKKLFQKPLDNLVQKLRENGVENTPYNDRI